MAVYIGTFVIVSVTFILYIITIYHLHHIDMTPTFENSRKTHDLLNHTAWFLGIAMAVSAFAMMISFIFMYRALKYVN